MTTASLPVMGLLIFTPLTIAGGQILFKKAGENLASSGAPFVTAFIDPIFILAVAIYGGATMLWLYVLKNVPLTYAYSFMALTFIFVPILAMLFLGEKLTPKYFLGLGLVISGLLIVQS